MITLNIHEAKTNLSKHLKELTEDKPILLCKRNIPIAKICAIKQKVSKKRPIGLAKGEFTVPKSFFEPLPDEMISLFEGHGV